MAAQPRIDEPSKPKPSSNESSPSSPMGKVRCCQDPGRSVKRVETNFAPCSEAYFKTDLALIVAPMEIKVSDVADLRPEAFDWCEAFCGRAVLRGAKCH